MKDNNIYTKSSTTTGGTSTTSNWTCGYPHSAQQGWECPRCGRINAPWISHCDCSRDRWSITWTSDHVDTQPSWTGDKPEWWKEITCSDNCPDNVLNNPNIYTVGGSDYFNNNTKTWENVPKDMHNSTTYPPNCHTPNFATETVVSDGINNFYTLKTPKETK